MPARRIVLAVLSVILLVAGFTAGLYLIRQRQDIREEASTPTGQATVNLFPESGTFDEGDTFPVSVRFNTANIPISGITVRLTYPYSGATPELTVGDIEINPSLLSSGDWTCPTKSVTARSGIVEIDINCSNVSAAGFASDIDTLLATFNINVVSTPVINPVVLRFESANSFISRRSDGQDILLIPTSTGTYTVSGAAVPQPTEPAVPTATPTGAQVTTTLTPTITSTPTPTSTTSSQLTPTTTAKGGELPDAGVSYPTIIGIGIGTLLIVASIILAL